MSKKHRPDTLWQFVWSKWIVLFVVFTTPLYATAAHWYPFVTPKALMVTTGTLVAAILWIWWMMKRPQESISVGYTHYVLGAFLFVLVVAAAFGINPHQSFFGTFYSSTSIVLLLVLGTLAVLIAEMVRRDSTFIRSLANAVCWSGVLTALITYLPFTGSSWQALALSGGSGFVGNSSFTGGFLVFALGYGVYALATATKHSRLWYGLGIAVILFCPMIFNADIWRGTVSLAQAFRNPLLFIGQAQGAVLGIVIAVIGGLALRLMVAEKRTSKIVGGVIGAIVLMGLVVGYTGLLNPNSSIHQKFAESRTSTRFVYWNIAADALKERPFLGWGFENYQTIYQHRFDPAVYGKGFTYEQWVSNPHNVLFDMEVSGGILGLSAYLLLFGAVGWIYIRVASKDRSQTALVIFPAILVGYLIQNLFIFDTPTTWLMYFVTIGIALGIGNAHQQYGINTDIRRGLAGTKIVVLAACIVVFGILPSSESRAWVKVRDMPISPDRIKLQERVQRISPMGSVDDDIVYAQKTLVILDEVRGNLTEEERPLYLAEVDSLIGILEADAVRYPENFYVRYLAGTLTHLAYVAEPARGTAALDAARTYFDEARLISPRNPKAYYNLAQNALFRKDTAAAIAFIKEGMALGATAEGQKMLDRLQKK